MKRYLLLLAILHTLLQTTTAQQKDTVQLREVEIYGMAVSRYSAGTKVNQIQSYNGSDLLSKALSDQTTAYFKTYGNNQLSTIALRGTSASHTAVLWNGININSPTLGQTDFALLPTFLMEDIAVQYGTSSSLYGSDALGGSVIVAQAAPRYEKGWKLHFLQQIGSFGRYFSGAKTVLTSGKFEFRTKVFSSAIRNDFPYTAPAVGYRKRQNDAAVNSYGFDQQVHFKINSRQQLSAEAMYTYNFRHIQPTVTHDYPDGTLKDQNGRFSINYQNDSRLGRVNATLGYILNNQVYSDTSTTRSDQVNVLVNADVQVSSKVSLRYGLSGASYFGRTANYPGGGIQEERYDGFFSYRQLITHRWTASLNLRQSLYAGRHAPFAPSLGSELKIVNSSRHKVVLRAQGSRGYRVPTLNDRYWIPGGNPNLKPEDAWHAEAGTAWSSTKDQRSFKLDVTAFKTWVNQWIIWLPGNNGIWSPSNLQKVHAYGMEAAAVYSFSGTGVEWQAGVNYGYTRSVNQKGLNDFDISTVGKQLPYVPVHIGSALLKAAYKDWSGLVRLQYTGLRYISLDNDPAQSLDPYALLDVSMGRNFKLTGWEFGLRAEANNIFNTYYENNKSYAMPGRNFALYFILNFKNKTRI